MSPELTQLQQHLADLEVFMASRAHVGFIAARRQEVKDIQDRILMLRPDTAQNIALINQAHGERDYAIEMVTTFEDARVALKALISKTADEENNNAQQMKL